MPVESATLKALLMEDGWSAQLVAINYIQILVKVSLYKVMVLRKNLTSELKEKEYTSYILLSSAVQFGVGSSFITNFSHTLIMCLAFSIKN